MKTLLALLALTLAVVCDARKSSSLPHPWLTLDRSAKVLRLVCRPPPQALDPTSSWQFVDDLKLLAFLPQHNFISNVSLVHMTSSWKEPRANPKFNISRTSFQGTWSSKSVSLEFLLPVTNKELGHYFCEVAYRDKNDNFQTFITRVAVGKNFTSSHVKTQPQTEQSFEVSVSDAHKVHVTWTKPEQSKFIQASVSRQSVGEDGKGTSPAITMFTTDNSTDYEYRSEVLLKKVNYQDGNNMSIILFLKMDQQEADNRYSCWVPYSSCRGEGKEFCTCFQQGNNSDRQVCPTAADCPETFRILFFVVLSLFFLVPVYVFFFPPKKPRTIDCCNTRNGGNHQNGDKNGGNHQNGDTNGGDHQNGDRNHQNGDRNSDDHQNGDTNGGNHQNGDTNGGDHQNGDANEGNPPTEHDPFM